MRQLLGHIGLHQLQRHMARAFNHHLHIISPGNFGQFAQSAQLGKLRRVVGVGNTARTQAITKAERHVVLRTDLANLGKMFVQEIFAVVQLTPLRQNSAAARHDAGDALRRQRDKIFQHTSVDGEVVDALLCLLNQRVAI